MVADAVKRVGYGRPVVHELVDHVAPDDGVAGLVVEFVEDVVVAGCVDLALEGGP